MNKRIIICSPFEYCGGALVLWKLCDMLCNRGYDARLFYTRGGTTPRARGYRFLYNWMIDSLKRATLLLGGSIIPQLRKSRVYRYYYGSIFEGAKTYFWPIARKSDIVIYHERFFGNPMRARHVVRYFLYYHLYAGNPDACSKDDLVICYRKQFNNQSLNPEGKEVTINYFDSQLYRRYNYGQRNGVCYVVRKGKWRDDLPSNFDGIIIDELTEEEKVKTFNECEYCYSYDTQTFYSSIAALCGCKSIVLMENGKTISDYLQPNETHYGVAWGDSKEQLDYAENTIGLLRDSMDYNQSNNYNVDKFITYINKSFGYDL